MSISDWLSARERRRYVQLDDQTPAASGDVPDGVWTKCEGCKRTLYEGELVANQRVCLHCDHHFDLTAPQRIELIADPGSFAEIDRELTTCDPLGFSAVKPYEESIARAKDKSDLPEAIVTGRASIGGVPVILGAMDFRYIGASMGSVVGEKVTRAFELATGEALPVVLVIASGGARMQEGMLSLMQMAKTSAAAKRHSDAGLPYLSVLTNPTYGGVTASFAVLADVILAEPGALIGFAGPRVIEQTIRQKLPKGFQSAEFMLEHGMVDEVVPRGQLVERLDLLLRYLAVPPVASRAEGGTR